MPQNFILFIIELKLKSKNTFFIVFVIFQPIGTNSVLLKVIMLNVEIKSIMLNVATELFIQSVIMLNVALLNVTIQSVMMSPHKNVLQKPLKQKEGEGLLKRKMIAKK
jgi:hypothetical protein